MVGDKGIKAILIFYASKPTLETNAGDGRYKMF